MSADLMDEKAQPKFDNSTRKTLDSRTIAMAGAVIALVVVFVLAFLDGVHAGQAQRDMGLPPSYDAPALVLSAVAVHDAHGDPVARLTVRVQNILDRTYRADCYLSVWRSASAYYHSAYQRTATGVLYEYPPGFYDRPSFDSELMVFRTPPIRPHNDIDFTMRLPRAPTEDSLTVTADASFASCTISPSRN